MTSDLVVVVILFLAVVGLVLLVDLVLVWRSNPSAVSGPERAQLIVAVAIAAFVCFFFLGRESGEADSAEPVAVAPEPAPGVDDGWVARLAVAARLPDLRPEERPRRERRKPKPGSPAPSEPAPTAEEPPDSAESSVPSPEPEPPPAPVPPPVAPPVPTPEPAPEPEPQPPPSFNDFG